MASIRIRDLRVSRGDEVVLDGVDLDVADGQRLALLAASGAGKTTLLRAVAGLAPVAGGRIWLGDQDVTDLPARDRGVGMVTQESTLQPHLDVRGNLAFPLTVRRVPAEERRRRVEAEAGAFSLRGLLPRRPRTLSAGQQHEVALARSLVRRVEVLLVDEPFANVDPRRRLELQRELMQVQQGYGVSMLLATNDQRVALGCAERIAVLDGGRVVQVAAPDEIFRSPATTFVAGLSGEQPMDLYTGRLLRTAGVTRLEAGPITVRAAAPALRGVPSGQVLIGIRPTAWRLGAVPRDRRPGAAVSGPVRRREYLGPRATIEVEVDGHPVHAVVPAEGPAVDEMARLWCPPGEIHVFDATSEVALAHGV